jgi:hypothetical protein
MLLNALGKYLRSYIKGIPVSPDHYFRGKVIIHMPGAQVTKKYRHANRPRKVHPWDQPRNGR